MRIFLLPLVLLIFHFGQAQKARTDADYQKAIHFSPFALLQLDYTLMAGAEYRIRPKLALVAEAGYIFASSYLNNGDFDSRGSGFIFRPSVRFYMGKTNTFYLQPQIFFKRVTNKKRDWIGRDCEDGIGAYEELKDFKYRRNVFGLNAIAGKLVPLGRKGRTFVDFYLGLGVKHKNTGIVDEPGYCYVPPSSFDNNDLDNGFFPNLPGGIKLVFVIQ